MHSLIGTTLDHRTCKGTIDGKSATLQLFTSLAISPFTKKLWSSSFLQNIPFMYAVASKEKKAVQDQQEGEIERQPLPVLAAPGMSDPKSDDPEEPEPLAFSTDDPESEPDVVTGLVDGVVGVVDAGLYPAVELDGEDMDDAKTQLPELGLALTSIAVPPKSQLEGSGFLW